MRLRSRDRRNADATAKSVAGPLGFNEAPVARPEKSLGIAVHTPHGKPASMRLRSRDRRNVIQEVKNGSTYSLQ